MSIPLTFVWFTEEKITTLKTGFLRGQAESQCGLGLAHYFIVGIEKLAPSRTPADGQRWVMVLRFV